MKLVQNLKKKNFSEVRKWCVNNLDNDPTVLLRHIYDNLFTTLVPASIPAAVLVIAKYQYQVAFSSRSRNKFVNMAQPYDWHISRIQCWHV